MDNVVVGMDPHKRSMTIEVLDPSERVLAKHRFGTDAAGFAAMMTCTSQWPQRLWAIEGCHGIGRHVAMRLVDLHEAVVDVPPKLSAKLRMYDTRQGRKTDPDDAHSIALAALRMNGLRPVVRDDRLEILRVLADRRRALGEDHSRTMSQVHQLLLELIPGGAKKDLSARQARMLLDEVQPADLVGRTRKRVAEELVGDLETIYQRSKALDKEIKQLVTATGSTLMSLTGIGPSAAARLLIEVADIGRFPTRNHFASWNGTAPLDASSGAHTRHRLSRAGNRQINRALHIMAVVQLRHPTDGRAYFDRRTAGGKTSMEAMRALKRRLSDIVYRTMVADALTHAGAGPGGHRGNDTHSSAAGSQPHTSSSDKPLHGPATAKPRTRLPATP